jgi:hypothetical protein
MNITRRAGALIAVLGAVALILAACSPGGGGPGGSGGSAAIGAAGGAANGLQNQTPDQVVRDAVAALRAAKSVQLVVIPPVGSGGPFKLADVQVQGDVAIATFVKKGRAMFEVAVVGKRAYIQFSREMLRRISAPGFVKGLMAGHWVRVRGNEVPPGIFKQSPVASVAARLAHHGPLQAAVRQATLNGRKVVVVTDRKNGAKLYVANTGRAYPLLVTWPDGHRIELTRYGTTFPVPTPANTLPGRTSYTGPSLI